MISQAFQVGDWHLAPKECVATNTSGGGHPVKLDFKQMQLLCFLALHAQKAVSRDEILDEVWRDQVVADDVLNVAISGLRKVLGDDSKSPHIIKTIPRVGYQLIAEVNFDIPEKVEKSDTQKPFWLLASIALLSIVVLAFFLLPAQTKGAPKLLVMPTTLTPDSSDGNYIANGITESLINQIAEDTDIQVISIQSALEAQTKALSFEELSNQYGVDFILTNQLSVEDEQLSIVSQLTNLENGASDWQKQYTTSSHTLYATQITIANDIAQRFNVAPTRQAQNQLSGEAYDLYLQGLYHVRQNQFTEAERYFLSSLNETDGFAPAYAGLAQLYFLKAWGGQDKTLDYMLVAERYANKAYELDPTHAQSLLNKALTTYFLEYDVTAANRLFESARSQNPSDVMILEWYQSFLINIGDFANARVINQHMRNISPLLFNKTAFYDILYFSGDYTGALNEIESVNPYMRSDFWASASSAWIYLVTKDNENFASSFIKVMQFFDLQPQQIEHFQQVLLQDGMEQSLLLFLNQAEGKLDAMSKAEILAFAGKNKDAIEQLTGMVNNREIQAFKIPRSPLLKSLHDEPGYIKLMSKLLSPVNE